jgi:hypothetical protein
VVMRIAVAPSRVGAMPVAQTPWAMSATCQEPLQAEPDRRAQPSRWHRRARLAGQRWLAGEDQRSVAADHHHLPWRGRPFKLADWDPQVLSSHISSHISSHLWARLSGTVSDAQRLKPLVAGLSGTVRNSSEETLNPQVLGSKPRGRTKKYQVRSIFWNRRPVYQVR